MSSILLWTAVLGTGGLALTVFRRRPPRPLWPSLFYVCLASFAWALGEAFVSLVVDTPAWHWRWTTVQYTGVLALPATWWLFGLRFAELHHLRPSWAGRAARLVPLVLAASFWAAMVTNPWHGGFITIHLHQRADYGPIWYVQAALGYVLLLSVLALFSWMRSKAPELRRQLDVVIFASLIPAVCNGLYVTHLVDPGFGFTTVGLAISMGLFFFGIHSDRLFALSPTSLQHLFEHESDGMLLLDPRGRLLHANPAAARLLEADKLAQNLDVFPLLSRLIQTGPEARQISAQQLSRELRSPNAVRGSHVYHLGSQPGRWISIEAISVPDRRGGARSIGMHLRDITHLREVRERVGEQAAVLEAVFSSVEEGLLVVAPDAKILFANRVFLKMWAIPQELIEAKDDAGILQHAKRQLAVPDAVLPRERELLPKSTEAEAAELRLVDGRIIEHISRPLTRGNRISGRLWSFRDVTEPRRAEDDRRRLEQRMQEAQRNESLGLLAGGIAHDFNNLLAGIMGNTELVLDRQASDPIAHECLVDVLDASRRAAELTSQMLAYSGRGRLVVESIDLSRLIREMADLFDKAVAKPVELRFKLESLPAIEGDPNQLRQVAMNLITNASDAFGGSGGTVLVRTRLARVEDEELGDFRFGEKLAPGTYIRLDVDDGGFGMDEGTIAKIFEPFFTTKFTGRGLGLAATLGIVRGHGGALRVHSRPGEGTRVSVLFPVVDEV